MSTLPPASRKRPLLRTAAYLFVEFMGFAALLFVTRFVARGHLVPQIDQECHIGGIAVEVLARGLRFPLLAYAPNEYDNGSLFSGLLAAASFSLFGRNVLALKLVTHLICAAGAVAALWLLRGCLNELGMTGRWVRRVAITTLVIAIALAPRVVTLSSTYAVGNHAEGAAIATILLALYAHSALTRSAARTAAYWALVGFALYLNKGTLLVVPVVGVVEVVLGWRSRRRLAAAGGGFALGLLPEIVVISQRHAMGWTAMAKKAERLSHAFPSAFVDSLWSLADQRVELLGAWAIALVAGLFMLIGSLGQGRCWKIAGFSAAPTGAAGPPVALTLVVGFVCLHLVALAVMAQGDLDAYAIYGYLPLVILSSLSIAAICARSATRWGDRAGVVCAAAAITLTLILYRPDAVSGGPPTVGALWHDRAAAACSWRFAEGFERELQYGLAPSPQARAGHAIERCRSLSEPDQVLDCIGGIARELHWRGSGRVDGTPPPQLTAVERRAYAYEYGTHRFGDDSACRDFDDASLAAECVAAVQLECLVFGDVMTRFASGRGIGQPRCRIPEPPMNGYWAAMRLALLSRPAGPGPAPTATVGGTELGACATVFSACY